MTNDRSVDARFTASHLPLQRRVPFVSHNDQREETTQLLIDFQGFKRDR